MAKPEGTSVTVFRPLIHALTEMGLKWRPLLQSCGIDPDLIADCEARVPVEAWERFWPQAVEFTGDPCFGLHAGEALRPAVVNIIGYLLMSSETLRVGLDRVGRYQRVVFGADWLVVEDRGASTRIRFETSSGELLDSRAQMEYRAALVIKMLDWIAPVHFRALEVHFSHEPGREVTEYERILHCPVKFRSKDNELMLSRTSLEQPSVHANPELARIHEEWAERHLAKLKDESVVRKVKTLLMAHLDRGPCTLPDVAHSLHMSPRTLQRRLSEEDTSYQDVLDSVRRCVCLEHLEHKHTCLAEIAYVAGFSDTSAFSRAVRRWTHQTPVEYRSCHCKD